MNISGLKHYYLIRCYEKNEYRKGFNEGTNIHISGLNYFPKAESEFQRDSEGIVFNQEPDSQGFIFAVPSNMCELLYDKGPCVESQNRFCVSKNCSGEDFVNFFLKHAEQIAATTSMTLSISGYICCFYLIPKSDIEFFEKTVVFRTQQIQDEVFAFLLQYSRENKEEKGIAYVTIYDAFSLVETLHKGMSQKGYEMACGAVKYEDITVEKKIRWFQDKEIEKIIFTKDKQFEYQKEFRIFFNTPNAEQKSFIEEHGFDFTKSIVKEFVYLSPEYAERIMRKNK